MECDLDKLYKKTQKIIFMRLEASMMFMVMVNIAETEKSPFGHRDASHAHFLGHPKISEWPSNARLIGCLP